MKRLVLILAVILSCFAVCSAEEICFMDFEKYQGGSKNTGFTEVSGEFSAAEGEMGGTSVAVLNGASGRLYKDLGKIYASGLYHLSFSFLAEGEGGLYIRLTDSGYSNYGDSDNMFQSFYCENQAAGYYNGTHGWVKNENTAVISENDWNRADVWLDLIEKKAYYYLNDREMGAATITDKLKSISGFWFVMSSESDKKTGIDNVSFNKADKAYVQSLTQKGKTVPRCGLEPLAITFETENTGKIFSDKDKIKIIAKYHNRESYEVEARASYTLKNSQNKQITSWEKEISLSGNSIFCDEIYPDISKYDIYNLSVEIKTEFASEKKEECEFSLVNFPEYVNGNYGICSHTNKSDRTDLDKGMEVVKKIGVGFDREDFSWGSYETEKGVYGLKDGQKAYFEGWLSHLEERGVEPLLIWGGANPNVGVPWTDYIPKSNEGLAALKLAAESFAREYKGRVTYYEFTNELNNLSQDVVSCEEYAKALEAFYDGIKKGNPDAFVLGHAVGGTDAAWQEKMLASGGAEHCDGMGVHYYTRAPEKTFPTVIDELKAMYKRNGWEHLGIWITEAITSASKEYNSPKEQGYYMVRNFAAFEGFHLAEKFFVYQLQTSEENERDNEDWFGMINGWDKADAYGANPAMLYLCNYLAKTENSQFVELIEKDGAYIYKYKKSDGNTILLMCAEEGVVPVSIAANAPNGILTDGYGNETELYSGEGVYTFGLTEDVVYFEINSDKTDILDSPKIRINGEPVCITEKDRAEFWLETDGEVLLAAKENYSVSNMGNGKYCISIENPDIVFEHIERNDELGRDEFKDYVYFSVIKDGKRSAYFPVAVSYVKDCVDISIKILGSDGNGNLQGEVTVRSNRSLNNISGNLSMISPADTSETFGGIYIGGLKPGEERKYSFTVPYTTASDYFGCTAVFESTGRQTVYGYLGECPRSNLYKKPTTIPVKQIKRATTEAVIDGILENGEWAEYKFYEFGNKNSDFSATVYAKWDDDYLYVASKVKDDIHTQNEVSTKIRLADSFGVKMKPTYSQRHENCVTFALAEEAKMNLNWTYFTSEENRQDECKYACMRNDTWGETVYEAKIPRSMLYHGDFAASENMYIGFEFFDKDGSETASKIYASWVYLNE